MLMLDETTPGYNDESKLEPTCGPDWDAIEKAVGGIDFAAELADIKLEDMERAFKVIQALMAWIHQNGSANLNGVAIRAIIVCWLTLPHLRSLTLTQVAKCYGLKKQSVGRWVEEKPKGLKASFPSIKTGHMNFE